MKGRKTELINLLVNGALKEAKNCSMCGEIKPLGVFKRNKRGVGGRAAQCKSCDKQYYEDNKEIRLEYNRKYYQENREQIIRQKREYNHLPYVVDRYKRYYEENKDKINKHKREYRKKHRYKTVEYYERTKQKRYEYEKEYRKKNPHVYKAKDLRRRAAKKSLPNSLTKDELNEIMDKFNGGCALTGDTENIHMDHFITLSTGVGGTVLGNIVPLKNDLNSSKQDKNPFEWFYENKDRFNLSQERFDSLIGYLADINGMGVDEYEAHVYNCYELKAVM